MSGSSKKKKTQTTANKRKQTKPEEQSAGFLQSEAAILGVFAVCVLLFLSNFHICGVLGDAVSRMMLGVFGCIGYIAPILLFAEVLFYLSNEGSKRAVYKMLAVEVLLFVFCGLSQLLFGGGYQEGQTFAEIYQTAGENGLGGGVIGGFLVLILHTVVGTIGAYLVLLVGMIIAIVCITERSFLSFVKNGSDRAYQYAVEDYGRRRERREELREERRAEQRLRDEEEKERREEERLQRENDRKRREEELRIRREEAEKRRAEELTIHREEEEKSLAEEQKRREEEAKRQEEERRRQAEEQRRPEAIPVRFHSAVVPEIPEGQRTDDGQAGRDLLKREDYAPEGMKPGSSSDEPTVQVYSEEDLSLLRGHVDEDVFVSREDAFFDEMERFQKRETSRRESAVPSPITSKLAETKIAADMVIAAEAEESVKAPAPEAAAEAPSAEAVAEDSIAKTVTGAAIPADTAIYSETAGAPAAADSGVRTEVNRTAYPAASAPASANSVDLAEITEPREGAESASVEEESEELTAAELRALAGEWPTAASEQRAAKKAGLQTEDGKEAAGESGRGSNRDFGGGAPRADAAGEARLNQIVTAGGKIIETAPEDIIRKKAEERRAAAEAARAEAEFAKDEVLAEVKQAEERPKPPYEIPPMDLLTPAKPSKQGFDAQEYRETATKLEETLKNFNVGVHVTDISVGPTVTRYELHPEQGVKVSRIQGLADDIKLNLAATDIRIEAPIPGKAAVGIEVPNKVVSMVYLRELLESSAFKSHPSKLAFAVGKDIGGQVIVADLAKMPHMLIAGQTGSGKSVCINTLIMSLIYRASDDDVKMILIDPKVVELSIYNGIPHLLIPVVTDPKKAAEALNWAVAQMMERYNLFAQANVRDIKGYNARIKSLIEDGDVPEDQIPKRLPQIVIIIDELADLMMVASNEVEDAICRLCQLARAAGIHLVIATQRPSVNVITGLIKANVPSRIAFSVASGVDSRTILDMVGAERLLGNGDMLFYPSGYPKPVRVQGAFVSDAEVSHVTDFLKERYQEFAYDTEVVGKLAQGSFSAGNSGSSDRDTLFTEAGRFIIEKDKASIGMLQRMFKIGFNRAARIMDQLAEAGIVGEEEGTKPRKILMSMEQFEEFLESGY